MRPVKILLKSKKEMMMNWTRVVTVETEESRI